MKATEGNLTPRQRVIYETLLEHLELWGEAPSAPELAVYMGLERKRVTSDLRRLEGLGLIKRLRNHKILVFPTE